MTLEILPMVQLVQSSRSASQTSSADDLKSECITAIKYHHNLWPSMFNKNHSHNMWPSNENITSCVRVFPGCKCFYIILHGPSSIDNEIWEFWEFWYPPKKNTWQWKITMYNRRYVLKWLVFQPVMLVFRGVHRNMLKVRSGALWFGPPLLFFQWNPKILTHLFIIDYWNLIYLAYILVKASFTFALDILVKKKHVADFDFSQIPYTGKYIPSLQLIQHKHIAFFSNRNLLF